MTDPSRPARVWYQSFVHPGEQAPYIERLQAYLNKVAAPACNTRCTASIRRTGISIR